MISFDCPHFLFAILLIYHVAVTLQQPNSRWDQTTTSKHKRIQEKPELSEAHHPLREMDTSGHPTTIYPSFFFVPLEESYPRNLATHERSKTLILLSQQRQKEQSRVVTGHPDLRPWIGRLTFQKFTTRDPHEEADIALNAEDDDRTQNQETNAHVVPEQQQNHEETTISRYLIEENNDQLKNEVSTMNRDDENENIEEKNHDLEAVDNNKNCFERLQNGHHFLRGRRVQAMTRLSGPFIGKSTFNKWIKRCKLLIYELANRRLNNWE